MKTGLLPLFFLLISCTDTVTKETNENGLYKLSHDQIISNLKQGNNTFYYAAYKDSLGIEISEALRKELNRGKLTRDFYADKDEIIKEIRVRHLKKHEVMDEIQVRCAMTFPFKSFPFLDIRCDSINQTLYEAHKQDQGVRTNDSSTSAIIETDAMNRDLVLSIIEKCGWELIDKSLCNQVFLIVQHMETEFMAHYYPQFVEFYNEGHLSGLNYARMVDRLLMNAGFKQIYGTQSVKNGFYASENVCVVNLRRTELGMKSIEESAERRGFVFREEDYLED